MRRFYKLTFAPNPQGLWRLIGKPRSHGRGIASKSRRLIDESILLGLGSKPHLAVKAMKLTVSRFGISVPGQLQRSNASTLSLVTLL